MEIARREHNRQVGLPTPKRSRPDDYHCIPLGGALDEQVDLRAIRIELAHAFGACVLVIHHSGHAATERPRGSSAIRANSDFLIGVFRDEKDMLATVEVVHQKDGELLPSTNFGLTSIAIGEDSDGDKVTSLVAKHLDTVRGVGYRFIAD